MTIQRESRPDRTSIATGLFLALLLAFEIWLFHAQTVDDSFITFRYAKNLLEHGKLAYNPFESPTEGFSNPLWLVLVLPGVAFEGPLLWSRFLGICCFGVTGACLWRLSKKDSPGVAGMAFAFCLSIPGIVYWHFTGLETPLVASLLTLSVYGFTIAEERPVGWLPVAVTALSFTRADALLLVGLLVFFYPIAYGIDRKRIGVSARCTISVVIAWACALAFRLTYFGEVLPNTYFAKVGGEFFADALEGLMYLTGPVSQSPLLGLALLSPLGLPFLTSTVRRQSVFVLGATIPFLAYVLSVGGDWMPLYRFLVPVLPLLSLIAARVLLVLVGRIPTAAASRSGLLLGAFFVVPLGGVTGYLLTDQPLQVQMATEVTAIGEDLGKVLKETLPPTALTANGAAGAAPYASDLANIDWSGVVDHHIAHRAASPLASFLSKGHRKGDGNYVLDRRPDAIAFVQGRSDAPTGSPSEAAMFFDPRFYAFYRASKTVVLRPNTRAGWVLSPGPSEAFLDFSNTEFRPATVGFWVIRKSKLPLTVFRRTEPGEPENPLLGIARLVDAGKLGEATVAAHQHADDLERLGLGFIVHPLLGWLYLRQGDVARASSHFAIAQRTLGGNQAKMFQIWMRTNPDIAPLITP
ncbi:MAG: hypothetical protein KC416_00045 [Myxococcales bacterium]|nr:hypothetical protein [Myxococcales bacterium]